jgi:phosphatidyl-myo-inositol dimannoside synthase
VNTTTLVVTNDFPPRIGGIESFVAAACGFLDDVVVLTSRAPGSAAVDDALPYPVVRLPGPLLPTRAVARTARRLLDQTGASRVLFGAAAPLALLAPGLRAAGATRVVALGHGPEVWWTKLPPTRALLRRIGDGVDALSTNSDFLAAELAPALSAAARARLFRLAPPVDLTLFRPGPPRTSTRRCVAVGRFVARKGFDVLLRSWPEVLRRWPADEPPPELVLVGDGPRRRELARAAAATAHVRFTGPLPPPGVAAALQSADLFALPIRTRAAGLEPEGLGLAALEAAACGLPVLIGNSGGAPETVQEGRTGHVLDPRDPAVWARHVGALLRNPDRAAALGRQGRAFVTERFGQSAARERLRTVLGLERPAPEPLPLR